MGGGTPTETPKKTLWGRGYREVSRKGKMAKLKHNSIYETLNLEPGSKKGYKKHLLKEAIKAEKAAAKLKKGVMETELGAPNQPDEPDKASTHVETIPRVYPPLPETMPPPLPTLNRERILALAAETA